MVHCMARMGVATKKEDGVMWTGPDNGSLTQHFTLFPVQRLLEMGETSDNHAVVVF